MKARIFVMPGLLMLGVCSLMIAGYCGLALIQASSLYTGERLAGNIRVWGSLGLGSATLSAGCWVLVARRVCEAMKTNPDILIRRTSGL